MDVTFINPFISSTLDVFDKMAKVKCTPNKPFIKDRSDRSHKLYQISAIIELTGALVNGMVSLAFSESLAMHLAAAFSKERIDECDALCHDALRELINVVAGQAKKDLPGGLIQMSLPRVIRTERVVILPKIPVIILPFDTAGGRFIMQIALQTLSHSAAPGSTANAA